MRVRPGYRAVQQDANAPTDQPNGSGAGLSTERLGRGAPNLYRRGDFAGELLAAVAGLVGGGADFQVHCDMPQGQKVTATTYRPFLATIRPRRIDGS